MPSLAAACPKGWYLASPMGALQGEFLDDVHRLHLPTLTWRGPPEQMNGQAAQGVRRVAGHTLTAGLAFGGCIATVVGIVPISKTDLLLLGEPPEVVLACLPACLLAWDVCLPECCERCRCRTVNARLLALDASHLSQSRHARQLSQQTQTGP